MHQVFNADRMTCILRVHSKSKHLSHTLLMRRSNYVSSESGIDLNIPTSDLTVQSIRIDSRCRSRKWLGR